MSRHNVREQAFLLVTLLVAFASCQSAPPKLLHEVVRLRTTGWPSMLLLASNEKQLGNYSEDEYPFSYYFGVFWKDYSDIYDGLKVLRAALLQKGSEFIFEIQTDGDIELAKKGYEKGMQFRVLFSSSRPLRDFRIITTGSMEEALLLSGDVGDVKVLVDENGKAISARQESHYRVEARLRLEIDRDKLRIYVPEEVIPEGARHCWSADRAAFEWDLFVGLALEPLEPIPTNVPDIYFLPMLDWISYPKGRSGLERVPGWGTIRASDASKKSQQNK